MSVAMGTRLHINIYMYTTTSVPMLVLLSQNAQSDEKVVLSHCMHYFPEDHQWSLETNKIDKMTLIN